MASRETLRFRPLRWIPLELRGELSQTINIFRWPVGSSSSDCALPSNLHLLTGGCLFAVSLFRESFFGSSPFLVAVKHSVTGGLMKSGRTRLITRKAGLLAFTTVELSAE